MSSSSSRTCPSLSTAESGWNARPSGPRASRCRWCVLRARVIRTTRWSRVRCTSTGPTRGEPASWLRARVRLLFLGHRLATARVWRHDDHGHPGLQPSRHLLADRPVPPGYGGVHGSSSITTTCALSSTSHVSRASRFPYWGLRLLESMHTRSADRIISTNESYRRHRHRAQWEGPRRGRGRAHRTRRRAPPTWRGRPSAPAWAAIPRGLPRRDGSPGRVDIVVRAAATHRPHLGRRTSPSRS